MRNKIHRESAAEQLRSMNSVWTESVNPEAPWPEYPRPQMQRSAWLNLNGPWEFAGYAAAASTTCSSQWHACMSDFAAAFQE